MDPLRKIYHAFGVPFDYAGPFRDEFYAFALRKMDQGMTGGHTSIVEGATAEQIVREQLRVDWELGLGHSYRVEAMDGFVRGQRLSWLGDRWREFAMEVRIFWHRKVLRLQNPFN
jgi:hypothetical protein